VVARKARPRPLRSVVGGSRPGIPGSGARLRTRCILRGFQMNTTDPKVLLVARARRGDAQAWRLLVDSYQSLLLRVACRCGLNRDDSCDVAQTTWTVCVERLDQLENDAAFVGWLIAIARRESYRVAAQTRRCVPRDFETAAPGVLANAPDDVAGEVSRRDEVERLRRAIADLPAHQRAVLRTLTSSPNLDYAAMARQLGVPVGSLGPTRARALKRLRVDPRLALAG
jgi:RNA polymerase sigma factor (sigma-70 family)